MSAPRAPRSLRRRLVLGLLVALGVFAATEGMLRLTLPVIRTATLPDTMIRAHLSGPGFRYDPDLYWYWGMLPSAAMDINEFGFRRTIPMTQKKPPGVKRVVTLGDSQTLGAGVKVDETYSAVAERELGPGWEVLDAGISGYRTLNVYRLLQLRIQAFQPDVIVVDCMPYDSPHDDGSPVGRPIGGFSSQLHGLLWQSRIYYLLRLGMEKMNPNRPRWLDRAPRQGQGESEGQGNHDLIVQWGKDHDVKVVFMQYPVSEENWTFGCHTLPKELPADVPVVPACDVLKHDGRGAHELFQDRNHLTVAGNVVVGKAVAATVAALK